MEFVELAVSILQRYDGKYIMSGKKMLDLGGFSVRKKFLCMNEHDKQNQNINCYLLQKKINITYSPFKLNLRTFIYEECFITKKCLQQLYKFSVLHLKSQPDWVFANFPQSGVATCRPVVEKHVNDTYCILYCSVQYDATDRWL